MQAGDTDGAFTTLARVAYRSSIQISDRTLTTVVSSLVPSAFKTGAGQD